MAKLKTVLTSVKSSNIAAIGYSGADKVMEVRYHNGKTYRYEEVSLSEYNSIKNAASVGSEANRILRSKPYQKL